MAITLEYVPHAGQREIHGDRDRRFRVVCCGRRFGKTLLAGAELLDIGGLYGGLYAWVAPTYYIAERGEDALRKIGGRFVRFAGTNPVRATFEGQGGPVEIRFLSADHPDMILGDGFDGVVVDEAARIDGEVWQRYIRPALADKQGWGLLTSTPRGRNWFFDLHTRGKGDDPQFKSYTRPSWTNPFVPAEEWEEARRTTPADLYRQEYEAEFLEDSAGVFRNIEACLLVDEPLRVGDVVIGVDLAKHTDWTVCIAMDRRTGHCLEILRFNQLDWPIVKERVVAFARRWGGDMILDATGPGDPVYDDLRRMYGRIEGFKFTNASKVELIQRLCVAIENREIAWPRAWETLTDELKRYEYKIGKTGTLTYSAPSGYHDDCVIALALANRGRYPAGGIVMPVAIDRPGNRGRQMMRALPGDPAAVLRSRAIRA